MDTHRCGERMGKRISLGLIPVRTALPEHLEGMLLPLVYRDTCPVGGKQIS